MPASSAPVLEAEDISVKIGSRMILEDIHFRVAAGEFIGIIGPNGAGKSTLLRCLRGLWPAESGVVRVHGDNIAGLKDRQLARQIAYMQQDINISFGFTALDVVLAGRYPHLQWWQNEREEDYQIAKKYMAFTGVERLATQSVQKVSGGERQRILLAKVLAQETALIFLDEPTASLDLSYQEEIFRYCRAICREGKTVLLVVHDIKLAAKFCSRLLLLANGKVLADGSPRQVITASNLNQAYGLHAAVFVNQITGHLDIHTYEVDAQEPPGQTVHIIGGGVATAAVMRGLYEKGYALTAGVLQEGDTDTDAAAAFQIDYLAGPAFCKIDAVLAAGNRVKISRADWVVLGNLYYGEQNLDNLLAAFTAARLVVIEDTAIGERDFTGGKATVLYRQLLNLPEVTVMTSAEFLAKIGETAGARD